MIIDNVCLKNEYLTVKISTLGAELKSIQTQDGTEWLHQKDMVFWNDQAPVLFPICGTPIDGKVEYDGTSFPMKSHGFAKESVFNLMEFSDDLAVFSLVSNDKTRIIYPFDFELIITYKLLGNSIDVSYEVINDTKGEMYFSVGSHEGYNCLEGLDNYEIHFEKQESENPYVFETGKVPTENIVHEGHTVLKLSNELFKDDITVVYEHPQSNYVTLVNKENGDSVRVEFEGFSNLLVWAVQGSQFVCIEPWYGMADKPGTTPNLAEKPDIIKLDEGKSFEAHHIISIKQGEIQQ